MEQISAAARSHARELTDLGKRIGAIVRTDAGDPRVRAMLLLDRGIAVLTLHQSIVGTELQEASIAWAVAQLAAGSAGLCVLLA